ncbi:MAG: YraN family protein [Actinobacteria bacterium]|nr:YraN family protein [Actinomycetota bacterium]
MDQRGAIGAAGEDAAARLYESRGFRILARNWRCRLGELDLVLARGDLLVVCEVKTRRGASFGGGYEAVTPRKRAKVRALAEVFLLASGARPGSVRFDVASVDARSGSRAAVELFEDAF